MAMHAWASLREQARECRNCPMWADATQTVFGEGPPTASILLVGEAPGDREDRQGRPFVGPAGQLLDRALAEAGIDRGAVYLTNAVKHFKFELRGRRRIHQKPERAEIAACKPWLLGEIDLIGPRLLVALGATAARSLLGRAVTVGRERGRFQPYPGDRQLFVTIHPSYLLRLPDEGTQASEYRRFVDELALIAAGPPAGSTEPAPPSAAGPCAGRGKPGHAAADGQRSLF